MIPQIFVKIYSYQNTGNSIIKDCVRNTNHNNQRDMRCFY